MKSCVIKSLSCKYCGMRFETKQSLLLHVNWHETESNVKPFTCKSCHLQFQLERNYNHHVRYHAQNPYMCKICKKFVTGSEEKWKDHIKSHPLYCPYCGQTCNTHQNLIHHLDWHEREIEKQQFVCQTCDKHFTSEEVYKGHVKSHHSNPYLCKICKDYMTASADKLIDHMKLLHPLSCTFCCLTLKTQHSFNRHVDWHEKVHKEKQRS